MRRIEETILTIEHVPTTDDEIASTVQEIAERLVERLKAMRYSSNTKIRIVIVYEH